MADMQIEIRQRGDAVGFHHGAFRIIAGKRMDRIRRLPAREHKELDLTRGAAPAKIGAAKSGYLS